MSQPVARDRFDEFLQQNPAAAAKLQSDADKEALFKQFQAWEAEQKRAGAGWPGPSGTASGSAATCPTSASSSD